eukprot:TRINITY_DN1566_c0_g1_i1.p1 TRINITY_DN1566_c0_g1~~TRINITY_DN1566_c0_g1_i1.p1  ORF type:complete len:1485 (+),score=528.53 TRINITY_DN1566_c0_g1_i1:71-4525(+)
MEETKEKNVVAAAQNSSEKKDEQDAAKNPVQVTKRIDKLVKKYVQNHADIFSMDYSDMNTKKGLKFVPMDQLSPLENLKQIFVTGHSTLREIPPEFYTKFGSTLKEAWLHDNSIREINEQVSKLTQLTELWFHKNKIRTIPISLCTLGNLKELRLDDNRLVGIPSEIGQLVNLEVLKLDYNEISFIPPEIGKLSKLITLSVSHNNLSYIPIEVGQLSQLKVLSLSNNKILNLPNDVVLCSKLEELHVDRNQIAYIPLEMVKLSSTLKVFKLFENCILNLPEKLIEQKDSRKMAANVAMGSGSSSSSNPPFSPEKIFGYLSDLGKGQEANNRIKLMIVGQENVGKTTLLGAIKGKTKIAKMLSGAPLSTDGIDIAEFSTTSLKEDKKAKGKEKTKSVKIDWSAWDFAGQEVYYSSHQFFLSSRAIYIVVWNLLHPPESSRLEYWLQSIKARAPKAPIVIVGTHVDNPKCTDEYLEELQEKINNEYFSRFNNIKFVCEVDAKKGKYIDELINFLGEIAVEQPRMGEMIPKSYLLLEEKVLKERKRRTKNKPGYPIMTMAEYSQMAVGCSISEDALPRATEFLYEIGVLIHFTDTNRGLNNLVFLDPRFLVDLMATVVSTKANFVRNGTVRWKHMQLLWKRYPAEIHSQLLALLEKFEIAIRLNKTADDKEEHPDTVILFPSFLDEAPIENLVMNPFTEVNFNTPVGTMSRSESRDSVSTSLTDHSNSQFFKQVAKTFVAANTFYAAIERCYQMAFLPLGLFSRLIVRLVALKGSQLNWSVEYSRNTIFLAKGEDWAFVQLQHVQRQIKVFVAGTDPTKLLRVISENLETLMEDWFPNLSFLLLVTCSHCLKNRIKNEANKPTSPTDSINSIVFGMVVNDSLANVDANPDYCQFSGKEIEEVIQKGENYMLCDKNWNKEKKETKKSPSSTSSNASTSSQFSTEGKAGDSQNSSNRSSLESKTSESSSKSEEEAPIPASADTLVPKKAASEDLDLFRKPEVNDRKPSDRSSLSESIFVNPNPRAFFRSPSSSPSTQLGRKQAQELPLKNSTDLFAKISENFASEELPVGQHARSAILRIIEPILYDTVTNPDTKKINFKIPLPEIVPDLCLSFLNNIIPNEAITIEKELGKGSFAVVYKGTFNGETVAVKQYKSSGGGDDDDTNFATSGGSSNSGRSSKESGSMGRSSGKVAPILSNNSKSSGKSGSNRSIPNSANSRGMASWGTQMAQESPYHEFRREATLMSELQHPNIMKFIGILMNPLGIVTEFLGGGDLKEYISNLPSISRTLRLGLALDMAKGISYLHNLAPPILHRDLKSPNVLVAINDDGTPTAKLGDLGLSRRLPTGMISRKVDNPRWLAPEVMENKPYDEKSDVYSFGIILWELVERGNPFEEYPVRFMMQLEEKIRKGARPTLRDAVKNSEYGKLFDDCVLGNPALRPSFEVILVRISKLFEKDDEEKEEEKKEKEESESEKESSSDDENASSGDDE